MLSKMILFLDIQTATILVTLEDKETYFYFLRNHYKSILCHLELHQNLKSRYYNIWKNGNANFLLF